MIASERKRLGVDTGGTFTDFVLLEGDGLRVHKVLSTPDRPEEAILRGIRELGLSPVGLRVAHGSTVATNAVLEGKGARTACIANEGLEDVPAIGRQDRPLLYQLRPPLATPPMPADWRLGVDGRSGRSGEVVEPLTEAALQALREQLRTLRPEAVAVNLLFSFLDGEMEERIAEVVPEGTFVSLSSRVLPEYREYERGIATWLNAYVGPVMAGYLRRLREGLPGSRISVMQSSGGMVDAEQAESHAVRMLLSGPAGGLKGAEFVGRAAGRERLLTFDMGGTSTDVALIDGDIRLTTEGRIGRYPVVVPMVDMHTIGAGGGSIAHVDAGGMLQVGPESAGAEPGPACYGAGGTRPTVTDANLVLGRLRPGAFLGGQMSLDAEAARHAVGRVAEPMGMGLEEAARGIVRVANENMAGALRVISVQRGRDPRDYTLMSFGGAGGLHVCALAEILGMRRAMVPVSPGVLSALGMLAAPRARELSRTLACLVREAPPERVEAAFAELAATGRRELAEEGVAEDAIRIERGLDLRYRGQSFTLNLFWDGLSEAVRAFHRAHEERYGHALDIEVELVNVRVRASGPRPRIELPPVPTSPRGEPDEHVPIPGESEPVPVYPRTRLAAGQSFEGPALVTETVSTTWVAAGWRLETDRSGNLMLERLDAG